MTENEPRAITEAEVRAILEAPEDLSRVVFDLAGQTVDALELVLEHLQRVPARPMSWKWALIGMHAALHGSFGLRLARSDGAQLLVPDQERQYWQRVHRERTTGRPEPIVYVTKRGKLQEPMTDWFLELFEKVQEPNRMNYLGGKALSPTPEQRESIEYLNANRGKLIHYSDTMLRLTVPEMLHDLGIGLTIVNDLLLRAHDADYEPTITITDPAKAERAEELIPAIRAELTAVRGRCGLQEPEHVG